MTQFQNPQQFNTFMQKCINWEKLFLSNVQIQNPADFDFDANIDYKLKYLSFASHTNGNNWGWSDGNPTLFDFISKAIVACKLKDSLKTMVFGNAGMTEAKIKEILTNHGLSNIEVKIGYEGPSD